MLLPILIGLQTLQKVGRLHDRVRNHIFENKIKNYQKYCDVFDIFDMFEILPRYSGLTSNAVLTTYIELIQIY